MAFTFSLGSHRATGPEPRPQVRREAAAQVRREPLGEAQRAAPRRHGATEEHAPWCVQHGPGGCEGQVFSLPGTKLLLWLSAPSSDDPRLVVEGPDGVVQLPVEA